MPHDVPKSPALLSASVAVLPPATPPAPRRVAWLDGPRVDLPFYIGSALIGWAALLAHAVARVPATLLYVFWILFLDGPHLWATISRTYLDREERRTRRGLLLASLAWAALPLGAITWGHLTGQRLPWAIFLAFVQVWAYWHVVRQHYGFLVLYQRKAGELAGVANRIEYSAFYTVMLAPFASFALCHPFARRELGLPAVVSTIERGVVNALGAATALAIVIYIANEIIRARRGRPVNVAKNAFLAACVPLHLVTLLHPRWSTSIDVLAVTVVVTSFHNLQYDAIVWRHGQRRYLAPDADERFGIATRLFRRVVPWYLAGLAFTVILRYASWSLDGRFWQSAWTIRALPGPFSAAEYVNAWWWIVAMHHYYLDQRIWRVGRDAKLRANLGLHAT